MNSLSGVCPNCLEDGELSTACPEKLCRVKGYHRIPHGMLTRETRLDPEIGLLVDRRYLVVKKLGEGGFGKVFVALQQPLGMAVALKLLKGTDDASAHATNMSHFKKEAQALAQLQHPNIVKILDFGFFERAAYLVMELIESGRPLKDEVVRRATASIDFTAIEVEGILLGVLSALEKAHSRGIIHRDIKPENIMLQMEPGHPFLPRVLDFGLAKFVDSETRSSSILGTPSYMAPEQLTRRGLGPWTDLYALGVIAFELMTGRRPFRIEVAEVIAQKLDPSFDSIEALSDLEIPPAITGFLRRALAFHTEERFQSAEPFRVAMRGAFAAAAISADNSLRSIKVVDLVEPTAMFYADPTMSLNDVAMEGSSSHEKPAGLAPTASVAAELSELSARAVGKLPAEPSSDQTANLSATRKRGKARRKLQRSTSWAGLCDVGTQKKNMDAFVVDPDLGLFVVCDGVGELDGAGVASAMSTQEIHAYLERYSSGPRSGDTQRQHALDLARVRGAIEHANSKVFLAGQSNRALRGMGATVAALAEGFHDESSLVVAHVGDSRVYRFREGILQLLTRDHSELRELADRNELATEAQIRALLSTRNKVARVLGPKNTVIVETSSHVRTPGDIYLLCTDGLSSNVDDWSIENVVEANRGDLEEAAAILVRMVKDRGGYGNVTVVLARIDDQ